MNVSDKNIPRRPLTVESTNQLRETLQNALTEMLKHSCPCHYPRFHYLTTFLHDNYKAGAVFCADTNSLISVARSKDLNYLKQTDRITEDPIGDYDADLVYTCSKCSTVYKCIGRQYSINFEFEYLITMDKKYGADIGADVAFPIPLLQGLFGFNDEDILLCAKEYKLATAEEVFKYLTERK
jgi:hypothetical protein